MRVTPAWTVATVIADAVDPLSPGFRRETLLALEVRRALIEEGVHSLAEILAHLGAQDRVFALIAGQRPPDATYRLLGDFERDRRMIEELDSAQFGGPSFGEHSITVMAKTLDDVLAILVNLRW